MFPPSDKTQIIPDFDHRLIPGWVFLGINPFTLLMEKLEKLTAPEPPRRALYSRLVYLGFRPLLLLFLYIRAECCRPLTPSQPNKRVEDERRPRCCRTAVTEDLRIGSLSWKRRLFKNRKSGNEVTRTRTATVEKKTWNTKRRKRTEKTISPWIKHLQHKRMLPGNKIASLHHISWILTGQMGHKIKVCCGKTQMCVKTL